MPLHIRAYCDFFRDGYDGIYQEILSGLPIKIYSYPYGVDKFRRAMWRRSLTMSAITVSTDVDGLILTYSKPKGKR